VIVVSFVTCISATWKSPQGTRAQGFPSAPNALAAIQKLAPTTSSKQDQASIIDDIHPDPDTLTECHL
jgi:hypothetical protein